jgi:hypothetical protein
VTLIPPTTGDPLQSTIDNNFYLRTRDGFNIMPYEILRRMFAGAAGPTLVPEFDDRLVTRDDKGVWQFPIILQNSSSAAAREVALTVRINNPDACSSVTADGLDDSSGINPGSTVFTSRLEEPIYRGLSHLVGYMKVAMRMGSRPRRVLHVRVRLMADRMRAKEWTFRIQLARSGFSVRKTGESFMY